MAKAKTVVETERDPAEVLGDGRADVNTLAALRTECHTSMTGRGKFEKCLEDFEKIAKSLPNESAAQTRRGTLQWILGNVENAARILEDCRASQEKFYFLGAACLETERFGKASEHLKEAYDVDKDNLLTALAYGEAVIRAGDFETGESVVQRLRAKQEENADITYLRGLLVDMQGDHRGALALYEKALDIDPGNPRALFRVAYTLDLEGEESRALELYMQLRKMKPMHINTMINLGIIYEDRSDYEKAIECYRSVIDFVPNHGRARLYLSDAEASLDMYYDEDAAKKDARLRQTLGQPLVDFSFSRRSREALAKLGLVTVGDLAAKSEEELLEVPNFGKTSLDEIKEFLTQRNLTLAYGDGGPAAAPAVAASPLQKPLDEMEFSSRVKRTLEAHEVATVGDLVQKTEKELKEMSISASALEEIREKLSTMGLHLRPA